MAEKHCPNCDGVLKSIEGGGGSLKAWWCENECGFHGGIIDKQKIDKLIIDFLTRQGGEK